ncbi:hypothetical protein GW17_00050236, partial [Ensete ventricosum]
TTGNEGRPGCVRYCASPLLWAYEELLAFHPAERSFRYKVADNNVLYVATFKVVLPPLHGGAVAASSSGNASAKAPNTREDEAFSFLCNFCSLHLWLPATCRLIAGVEGQPGCVRYCATAPGDSGEQLQGGREHNMGLPRYVARLKVLPLRDDGRGEGGCELRWPFHSDPLQAWTKDGFVAYLQTGLEGMAEAVRTNEKNLKQ